MVCRAPRAAAKESDAPDATTLMNSSPAGAGALLIGTILACAAVGLGIGALIGLPALLGLVGGFVGVGVGFWVVYGRFKDL